ncbi:MAG TPA: glycoside hydrolase family 15 protein [Pseudolabrys sp.]|nr:glycoside hydrolase family 15 protein [Pseudolabrys sp.]
MTRTDFDSWIARQAQRSADAMEKAISATHLTRRRETFGQVVVPARGSVLASPAIADWNPEPDYFFHWLRDSAIVMRSVAEQMEDAASEDERARWRRHFEDFVGFSLRLCDPDGMAVSDYRPPTRRGFRKFLRPRSEIVGLADDKLLSEPRFNPDGTIDIFRWSRPQYDGPALRALACLRYLAAGGAQTHDLARLLRTDLSFTVRHAGKRCIGPWEEPRQNAHHYYVALVQLGAITHGRAWAGDAVGKWEAAIERLRAGLERHWSDKHRVFMARRPTVSAEDMLDAAYLLAVWDADLPEGPHSIEDARVPETQAALEEYFARELPINRERPTECGVLLGRYPGDRYFGGGAWYPTTLAAAGLYYRRAQRAGKDRDALMRRGDAIMRAVWRVTPEHGALSEQIDRATGRQTSARDLTWSYAAFVATARARAQAITPISRAHTKVD